MAKRFETEDNGEIENCYLVDGVYVPWTETAAQIDAKWDRIERRERIINVAGGLAFIVFISWVLVSTGVIDRGPAPSQSQSRSR